jgi:hypothetical protein
LSCRQFSRIPDIFFTGACQACRVTGLTIGYQSVAFTIPPVASANPHPKINYVSIYNSTTTGRIQLKPSSLELAYHIGPIAQVSAQSAEVFEGGKFLGFSSLDLVPRSQVRSVSPKKGLEMLSTMDFNGPHPLSYLPHMLLKPPKLSASRYAACSAKLLSGLR